MSGHRRGSTLYYRCRAADLIPAQQEAHPSLVYVREDKLVRNVEDWLLRLFGGDALDSTLTALLAADQPSLGETTQRAVLNRRQADVEKRLTQYKAALGQGADPALVTAWINEATAEMGQIRKHLLKLQADAPDVLGRETLVEIVGDMSLLVARLRGADPEKKAALYRDLGLRLTYSHAAQKVEAEVSTAEACAKRGVRGGT